MPFIIPQSSVFYLLAFSLPPPTHSLPWHFPSPAPPQELFSFINTVLEIGIYSPYTCIRFLLSFCHFLSNHLQGRSQEFDLGGYRC